MDYYLSTVFLVNDGTLSSMPQFSSTSSFLFGIWLRTPRLAFRVGVFNLSIGIGHKRSIPIDLGNELRNLLI